ncbi:MAG: GTPase domain-containing protein [Desulfobacteraceae bacterium]|jgi:signal recognition particle receptor subunit beta
MAEFDSKANRLTAKIVYYGPALSGKTTNLMRLHDMLKAEHCGDFMAFETKGDRTLFFDFLPLLIKGNNGLKVKIKLYTVPGQVAHDATRKAVLSRADGVIFVADSQINQAISNFESFDNLEKNAGRVGLDFLNLPLVIQFNKRDLNHIVSEDEVLSRWKPTGLPLVFGSALYGRGVRQTFVQALKSMFKILDQSYDLADRHGLTEEKFLSVIAPQP